MNTTFTNAQITAGAAVLDLDLDELQALCDAVKRPWYGTLQIADGVTDDDAAKFIEAFSPDTVSELIAAVRHAPSPQIAEKVELPQDFRERFKDAYQSLSVAAFASPFWNQSMEELLSAVDAELNKRADAIAASRRAEGCKWPTCQPEQYQDALAAEIHRDLYSGDPAPASAGQAAPAPSEQVNTLLAAICEEAGYANISMQGIRDLIAAHGLAIVAQPAEGAGQAGQVEEVECRMCHGEEGAAGASGIWMTCPRCNGNGLEPISERAAAPADHEIREAVNKLRDVAVQFHAHQSLRDRIASVVLPLVRATHQPSAQDGGEHAEG